MILRASDRAISELLARNNLRAEHLWRELDAVQEAIERATAYPFQHAEYARLIKQERELLAQLDRVDD